MDKQQLIKKIDENNTISFDIFDTLLLRNIYKPTDVFKVLAKIALEKYNINDFFNLRIESEKNSRTSSNNYECHFDDIYNEINKKIKNKTIVSKLKNEELLLEEKFLIANPFMFEIYNYCLEKNKKIILISDMYLDKNFINKILKKCGYKNYILYLSNIYKKTKGDASLYEEVFKTEKIEKNEWLHIGDNYQSDYKSPTDFGINAYQYKGVYSYTDVNNYSIFEAIILGIRNNYLYNGLDLDYWDSFGAKNVSIIYFGFTKWLYDLTKNLDNLFFLARDGYIFEKLYSLFDKEKKVHTNYLYCSRKSLVIPSIYTQTNEEIINTFAAMFPKGTKCTIKEFLIQCDVDIDSIDKSIISTFGFKSFDTLITEENFSNLKKMLVLFIGNIKKNLKEKYEIAIDYLKQEGVDDYQLINIMDIGWGGSTQNSIKKLLTKDVNGYYFGTINLNKEENYSAKFGYYFDFGEPLKNQIEILENVMMYELIFSAPHGSTIGYEKKGKKIVPILKDNIEYNDAISKFQKSAIELVKKYTEYIEYFDYLSREFCVAPYNKFINERNFKDIQMFSNLSNDYILGNNHRFNYINRLNMETISNDESFLERAKASLWPYTFLIEDDELNERKYSYYKSLLFTHRYSFAPLSHFKLYLDYGEGFNEADVTFIEPEIKGNLYKFRYKFNNDKSVKKLRIDPVENNQIFIKNLSISSDNKKIKVTIPSKNIFYRLLQKGILISSNDPQIIINNTSDCTYIEFIGSIEIM